MVFANQINCFLFAGSYFDCRSFYGNVLGLASPLQTPITNAIDQQAHIFFFFWKLAHLETGTCSVQFSSFLHIDSKWVNLINMPQASWKSIQIFFFREKLVLRRRWLSNFWSSIGIYLTLFWIAKFQKRKKCGLFDGIQIAYSLMHPVHLMSNHYWHFSSAFQWLLHFEMVIVDLGANVSVSLFLSLLFHYYYF